MSRTINLLSAIFALLPISAHAQSLQNFVVLSSDTILAVSGPPQFGVGGLCSFSTCVSAGVGVTLGGLSSALGIPSLSAKIDDSLVAIASTKNQIANVSRDVSRSLEIGAIAAAMRDAIPNPGDRFAFRLNAAGFDGHVGGSLGFSMNVTDNVRLSANYGRGNTQNVVSGGVNISFR